MTDRAPAADYPVYFRDGGGFTFSIETHGLRLDETGLTFTSERETRTIRFDEIRSIRLHTTFANAGDMPIGVCQIGFGRHRYLTVLSGDSIGRPDEPQRQVYRDFVRAFHRRIPAAARARIAFQGGLSEQRHLIVSIAMIAGAALFVVLPIVLIFLAPSWQALGVAGAGFGLAYAGWNSWNRNRPVKYAPDRIPDDLLP